MQADRAAFERWFLAQSQIEHGGQSPIDMLTHYEACWRAWRASEARSMGHAVCTRCGGTGLEP